MEIFMAIVVKNIAQAGIILQACFAEQGNWMDELHPDIRVLSQALLPTDLRTPRSLLKKE